MSEKSKQSKKSNENIRKEDVIQAVVIADNFSSAFQPLTHRSPVPLLPLVNIRLIDYTLEFLSLSGVQETIIFCCSYADALKEHISKSKWLRDCSDNTMSVNVIVSEGCRSLGDAMRDLDAKAVIRSDFVLLFADTVANINLVPLLEKHRNLQKQDKGAVMTLLFKEAGVGHFSRSPEDETILGVHKHSNRILFHKKQLEKVISFPLEIFVDNSDVSLRYDLQDTQISLCSPSVPPLFSDNFDFQTRDDFVRGLLMNEEILCNTIYLQMLQSSEYCARVSSLRMYQAVSHDVIHRWTYPFVPESPIDYEEEPSLYLAHHNYRHRSATLAKGCVLEEDVVLGEKTCVGEHTVIARSVIGRNCRIGSNVVVTNSFIWDNVQIKDGCHISFSVIGNDCKFGRNVNISSGCVIGPSSNLIDNLELSNTKVSSSPIFEADGFSDNKGDKMEKLCEGAFVYQLPECDMDYQSPLNLGMWTGEDEEQIFSDEESCDLLSEQSDISQHGTSPLPDDVKLFYSEVVDSLSRGYEDKLPCDNLILEINSSRYAYNVGMREVNFYLVKALMAPPAPRMGSYFPDLKKQLDYFLQILQNYIRNEAAQQDCLQAIEETCTENSELLNAAVKVFHYLYLKEILEEHCIMKWYGAPEADLKSATVLRKNVEPFIQWLNEADEESDE